jgi:electron transport complex protein RnfD
LPERFTHIASSTLAAPFMEPTVDAVTGATPLAAFKFEQLGTSTSDLALGIISGSTGETCALLILLGGLYLVMRNMMNWRIPVAVIGSAFALSGILFLIDPTTYPSPVFMIFSGGLMLGAVFMATDMVASPLTPAGVWVYGAFIGIVTIVIRIWGGLPEGVMYSILLANAVSPHIDTLIQPRVYGTSKKAVKA